jgi:hypothetical protein
MRKFSSFVFLTFIFWPSIAGAAPQGLYGKTVTVSWNETRSQRDGQSGPFQSVSIPFSNVYYISTQGHIFLRSTAKGGSGAGFGSVEVVGTGAPKGYADARNVTFTSKGWASSLVSGAMRRHTEVAFDGGFTSCSARVVTAIQSGSKTAVTRSIATGGNVEFESVSAGPASCSVVNGNAFAQ